MNQTVKELKKAEEFSSQKFPHIPLFKRNEIDMKKNRKFVVIKKFVFGSQTYFPGMIFDLEDFKFCDSESKAFVENRAKMFYEQSMLEIFKG